MDQFFYLNQLYPFKDQVLRVISPMIRISIFQVELLYYVDIYITDFPMTWTFS